MSSSSKDFDLNNAVNKAKVVLDDLKENERDEIKKHVKLKIEENEELEESSEDIQRAYQNLPTINEELERQRERFWLSLVDRGFIKPFNHIKNQDNKNLEHLHTLTKEIQVGSSLSSSSSSFVSASKSEPREQTGEDKNEHSIVLSKENHSNGDVTSESCEENIKSENQYHSLATQSNDSDSMSEEILEDFPSYNGDS